MLLWYYFYTLCSKIQWSVVWKNTDAKTYHYDSVKGLKIRNGKYWNWQSRLSTTHSFRNIGKDDKPEAVTESLTKFEENRIISVMSPQDGAKGR